MGDKALVGYLLCNYFANPKDERCLTTDFVNGMLEIVRYASEKKYSWFLKEIDSETCSKVFDLYFDTYGELKLNP